MYLKSKCGKFKSNWFYKFWILFIEWIDWVRLISKSLGFKLFETKKNKLWLRSKIIIK